MQWGSSKPLRQWVQVTGGTPETRHESGPDGFQYLGSDGGHLVLCSDSEEGRECGEVWRYILFRESVEME